MLPLPRTAQPAEQPLLQPPRALTGAAAAVPVLASAPAAAAAATQPSALAAALAPAAPQAGLVPVQVTPVVVSVVVPPFPIVSLLLSGSRTHRCRPCL